MTFRLYFLQRATAMVLTVLVAVHLLVIFYATSRGLSAADILGRTRGSLLWGGYYALFVVMAAVHGAIGVRSVAGEWTRMKDGALDMLMWGFGIILIVLGMHAVAAVVLP